VEKPAAENRSLATGDILGGSLKGYRFISFLIGRKIVLKIVSGQVANNEISLYVG
jgi:hypothetical protein